MFPAAEYCDPDEQPEIVSEPRGGSIESFVYAPNCHVSKLQGQHGLGRAVVCYRIHLTRCSEHQRPEARRAGKRHLWKFFLPRVATSESTVLLGRQS